MTRRQRKAFIRDARNRKHCRQRRPTPMTSTHPTKRTHLTPTTDTVECRHCNEAVADRPSPPADDDAAWGLEANAHRFGCAAVLTRDGARPTPVAPLWARGKEYRDGDPAWFTRPDRSY